MEEKQVITHEEIKTAYFTRQHLENLDGREKSITSIVRTFQINFPGFFYDENGQSNPTEIIKFLCYNFKGFRLEIIEKYIGGADGMDWIGPVRHYK